MMKRIYELGSTSGSMVAFFAFLLLSLGISLVLYAVIVRRSAGRALFQSGLTLPPPLVAVLCTVVFGLLFGGLYATTLQGFYRVELLDGEVRLHYLFPAHTVTLPRVELTQAERVPAHRGHGLLRLHTGQGVTYESALANDRAVRESLEGLNAYLSYAAEP